MLRKLSLALRRGGRGEGGGGRGGGGSCTSKMLETDQHCRADKQTDRPKDGQADRRSTKTDRQAENTDIQPGSHTDRRAIRKINTNREKYINSSRKTQRPIEKQKDAGKTGTQTILDRYTDKERSQAVY